MALRTMIRAISMAEPDAEKLFTVGSILQSCGYTQTARLMIEKAVCKQYPALIHACEDFKRFPEFMSLMARGRRIKPSAAPQWVAWKMLLVIE